MRKYSSALFVLLVTAGCAVKTEKAADTVAASDSVRGITTIDSTTPPPPPSRAGGATTTPPPSSPDTATPNPGTSFTVDERGIGPIRAGMTVAEAAQAMGGGFGAPPGYNGGCGYAALTKAPRGLAVMLENNKVARVEIRSGSIPTSVGAKIGDTEARIKSLYGARVTSTPAKYDPKGHYLTVTPTDKNAPYRIVFETDGKVVTNYRSGQLPAVEYVERCG